MIKYHTSSLNKSIPTFCHGRSGNASFTKGSLMLDLCSIQLGQFSIKSFNCELMPKCPSCIFASSSRCKEGGIINLVSSMRNPFENEILSFSWKYTDSHLVTYPLLAIYSSKILLTLRKRNLFPARPLFFVEHFLSRASDL